MNRVFTCLAGLALWGGALPVQAAESPPEPAARTQVVMHMELLVMSDKAADALKGQTRIVGGFPAKGSSYQLLQSTDLMFEVGKDALFFVGKKSPITYFDPRASQFQVQYVDTGVKLDVKLKPTPDNDFHVMAREEVSILKRNHPSGLPVTASYPETNVYSSQNEYTHVHYGESIVAARVRGTSARLYLEAMGHTPIQTDNILIVLTMNRP